MRKLMLLFALLCMAPPWLPCLASEAGADAPVHFLEKISGPGPGAPVILVPGANDGYAILSKYAELLKGATAYGFVGRASALRSPLNADTLEDNARMLASALEELAARGHREAVLAGACIGSFAALRAAQLSAGLPMEIRIVAFAAPLGGFSAASGTLWLPGAALVAKALGFAMSADLAPQSPFMRRLEAGLPPNALAALVFAPDDPVAKSSSKSEAMRENANLPLFKFRCPFVSGADHFAAADPDFLLRQGISARALLTERWSGQTPACAQAAAGALQSPP